MTRYFVALSLAASLLTAQSLDPKLLLKPPADAWPTYNGDYSGKRFSPLSQIDSGNIDKLTLAWMYRISNIGPQRGVGNPEIKSTPLMVNGILYFTVPDHVWALDARTARSSGISVGKITAATWWAIADWACTAIGSTS